MKKRNENLNANVDNLSRQQVKAAALKRFTFSKQQNTAALNSYANCV